MTPQEIEELSWRMGEVYEAVVNRILVNLARHFRYIEAGEIPSGAWEYQVKKLAEMGQINRETERIILEMLGDADGALQALLEESIMNGLRDAEPALRSAAEKGFLSGGSNIPPVLAPNQMQAFKAFYAQSADKLNLVNTVMLESTQAAFAATVSDIAVKIANTQGILNAASGEVVTGVSAWNKAMRDAVNKMVDNGLTGYIDHAGRHWSPEAYVTMDIRSTMANTARAAVFERNEEYGNDLYQVSWHNGARPLCYPWQGKVISRTGNARVVEDDEGNEVQVHTEDEIESFNYGGGLFGVNCGHYPIPFIPGFSRIRSPQENFEENLKTYEESQQQRALERKLRNEKRDLEVLKAQGASEDVLKEQRRRVRKASNDIDEFCAETGRARRRNREYTPIDPKFPDPDTYDPKLFPNDEKSKIDNWFRNGNDTEPPMVNIHAGGDDVPPAREELGYSVKGLRDPHDTRPRQSMFDTYEEYEKAKAEYKERVDEYNRKLDEATEKATSVQRFNSKSDVTEWAKSQGITIDDVALENLDIRVFNESSYALDDLFKRFPEVKSYWVEDTDGTLFKTPMFKLGVTDDSSAMLSANGGINFSKDFGNYYETMMKRSLAQQTDGFNVVGDGTFSTLIRHEYGHNVQTYIEMSMSHKYHYMVEDWSKNFSTFDEFMSAQNAYRNERNKYLTELRSLANLKGSSEYSNTNIGELFAEGFAEYASGGKTEFGIAFGEFLKRWYY